MKYFLALIFSFFLSFSTAYAQENTSNVTQIRGELIQEMHEDGVLSIDQKNAALTKYAKEYEPGWKEHLTWINTFKVFGVILLMVAFSNLIFKIGTTFIYVILAVPVILYQTLFLSLSIYGLLLPQDIWNSEYQYVALFCSISTLMTGFWIIEKNPKFFKKIFDYLFRFDLFVPTIISFWLSIYFGTLTYFYGSLFSWMAVISIGTFSSSIFYQFTGLKNKDNILMAAFIGHAVALISYAILYYQGNTAVQVYNQAMQSYTAFVIGVCFIAYASPWTKFSSFGAISVLCTFIMASILAYSFHEMHVASNILFVMIFIYLLMWISYTSYRVSSIMLFFSIGSIFYGIAYGLQNYGHLLKIREMFNTV